MAKQEITSLLVRVTKEFGYYDDHKPGEIFYMPLQHVTECIQRGFIEIVVNNLGENSNIDRTPYEIQCYTPQMAEPWEEK